MNKLEIRGVIVPSAYDSDWTQEYIKKGIITPESHFRRALSEADPAQPLDIYINSPGGSVFSGYEMVNAVREWKAENKQPVTVTIGAMAASAASAFAINVNAKIRAHQNAKMMFHGATSDVWGGKEAMEDSAALLEKINAEIKTALVDRYKMNPDTVAEWFSEGRMGWMNAEEMYRNGIAGEIIGDDDEEIQFLKEDLDAIDARGLDIAALLEGEKDGNDEPDGNGGGDSSAPPSKEPAGKDDGDVGNDLQVEYRKGYEDGAARGRADIAGEYAEQIDALKTSLESAQAESRKFQGEADKLKSKLIQTEAEADRRCSDLRAQLDDATEKLRKYVSGALKFSPAIETWDDALAANGGDYAKAAANHPDLLAHYREQRNNRS